ncbi:MAG: protein kinase [Verrucomicrobia bacterium]|nr:protein kinase [Verrucomicrobiota bacterium]
MQPMQPCPICQRLPVSSAPEGLCPKCLWASLLEPDGELLESGDPPWEDAIPSASLEPRVSLPRFDDYELLGEIARGGMGVVYRARQISLQRIVALKTILTARLPGESEMRRFRAEAEAVASLEHPHIVPIFEVGENDGVPYFTMKYVAGGSLADQLSRGSRREEAVNSGVSGKRELEPPHVGSYDFKGIVILLAKVARAVHHAHQHGILHRDIKPSNILLDEQDEPLVTDFGLAKQIETDSQLTLSGTVLGTPAYIAPEQASGNRSLTIAADIYSLGAVFYELLAGQPPSQAETPLETLRRVVDEDVRRPSALNPGIDRDLETICLKCLQKNPARRYASAGALAEDLERWQRHEPIRARRVSAGERLLKWTRRHPAFAALLLVAFVTPAVMIAVLFKAQATVLQERNIARNQERKANDSAASARASAHEVSVAREHTRQHLYAADMLLAQNALDQGNLEFARNLVEAYRPGRWDVPNLPGAGGDDLRGFEWRYLWARCRGDKRQTLEGHLSPVYSVAFSPDGKQLASGDAPGKVLIWDIATLRPSLTLNVSDKAIVRIAFSHDGGALATGDELGRVKVWDLRTRDIVWRHEGRNVAGVQFSPITNWIGVTEGDLGKSTNSVARVVDWTTGREVFRVGPIADFEAFTPDGRCALVTRPRAVGTEIWDLELGRVVKTVPEFNGTSLVSPDGRLSAGVWPGRGIFLAHLTESQPSVWLSSTAALGLGASLAFSPDGTHLASAGSDQVIRVWNMSDGREVGRLLGHLTGVTGVAFSPDGRHLATAGMDHKVLLWPTTWKNEALVLSNTWPPYVLSPDGLRLAGMAGTDVTERTELQVWNTHTLQSVTLHKSRKPPMPEFFSGDSQTLFAREEPQTNGMLPLLRWDLRVPADPPNAAFLPVKHTTEVLGSAATLDGSLYAVGQRGTDAVSFWNPLNGQALDEMNGRPGIEIGVPHRFSPDGRHLATHALWSEVRLLDRSLPQEIPHARLPYTSIRESAFSPDGRILALACEDHCIHALDTATLEEVAILRGHQQPVVAVAFSPDGRTLASCSLGGAIKLWSWPARREAATLAGGPTDFCFLAFSPDGNTLVAGGWGQTQIFRVPSFLETDREW